MRRAFLPLLLSVLAGALLLTSFFALSGRGRTGPAESFAYRESANGELPKLWDVPAFSAVDQQGRTVTPATLKGQPWIVDFIYTQCSSACPMMTSRLVLAQRALAGVGVRFVSFSVDPAHDTPAVLADYARQWNANETRWTLLATPKERLQATVDAFHVTADPSTDPANPIIHSSVFLLVDADGWVRGVYDSSDTERRARLVADARRLAAQPKPADASSSQHDESLYTALGCAGCHANVRIAPSLVNVLGRDVMLQDGSHVTADQAYLRRSILEPGVQLVGGYSNLMPSYSGALSDAELTTLVQEVGAMKSAAAAVAAPPAKLVADPVCGMKVRAAPETVHTTYKGQEMYFCSETCRDSFLEHPSKFEKAVAGTK